MTLFQHFLFFQIIFIFFSQINAECPKDKPFLKGSLCQSNCTSIELETKKCSISNSIIKKQYLNDIMQLGETDFQHLSVISNPYTTNELILETSYDRLDISSSERIFYILKSDNYYYNNKDLTTPLEDSETKMINLTDSINRGVSEIMSFNINQKSGYIFNLGLYSEIYDMNSIKNPTFYPSANVFNESIFSQRNSLILNNNNDTIAGFITSSYFNLYKFEVEDAVLPGKLSISKKSNDLRVFPTYMVNCFYIKNYIKCLLRNEERKLIDVLYYSSSLDFKTSFILNDETPLVPTYLFAKCIFLFEDVYAYAYFINDESGPLLEIKSFDQTYSNLNYFIPSKNFPIEINKLNYPLSSHFNKNDFVKMNDSRFVLISVTTEDNISYNIILFVFTLFDNNSKLENRIYKIPFYNLYHFMPKNNIRLLSISNYFGLGFTAEDNTDHSITTKFMFLTYINSTEYPEYKGIHVCCYDNNVTLPIKNISTNFFINNNFFGLTVKKVAIIQYPSNDTGLIFYKNISNTISSLERFDEFSLSDSLIITVTKKLTQNYTIYYAGIAYEPEDYETYDSLSEGAFEDLRNISYVPNSYYGKLVYFKLNYEYNGEGDVSINGCCHKNCEKCEYVGGENNHNCTKCKNNFYYKSSEYFEEYPLMRSCYERSDGFYINKTSSLYFLSDCHKNCKTCDKEGNSTWNNCILCKENFYKKEEEKNDTCYDEAEQNYFLNSVEFDPPKYSKCSLACEGCFAKENAISTNCNVSQCNIDDNYYYYENDKTNCKNVTKKHYLDGEEGEQTTSWQKCHENCSSCFGAYDSEKNDMKCIKCLEGYTPINNTNNCYKEPPPGYFYYDKTKNYTKCSDNCKECFKTDKDICTSCNNGTFIDNSNNKYKHPYCKLECRGEYYFNPETLTCTTECPEPSEYYYKDPDTHYCVNCYSDFNPHKYFDKENPSEKCLDNVKENYIYDTKSDDKNIINFGIIEPCFENCKTCSKSKTKSTTTNQNCITCKGTLYLRYDTHNCFSECDDSHHEYYALNNQNCINCKLANMNTADKKIYKFINETVCVNENSAKRPQGFYIIDLNTGTIDSCHKNCKTCSQKYIDDDKQNCDTCFNENGYYKISGDPNNICTNQRPIGYYLDKNYNEFRKCYEETCTSCEGPGTYDNNQCLTCKENHYYFNPKHKCVEHCNDLGYNTYLDECLDNDCIFYNYTSKGTPLQLIYKPLSTYGARCEATCDGYMFENVYICLTKCTDILQNQNIYNNFKNYVNALKNYYLANDDFFYSIIDNGNNKPKYCVSNFYNIEDSYNKIKGDNYITNLFFKAVNNKACTDYNLIKKLKDLYKVFNFDYNDQLYNVEIGQNKYTSYRDDELIIDSNCILNDTFTIKYSLPKDELYSNYIYFEFYEIKNENEPSCLIKKNMEEICPNYQYYTIRSPLNLNKFPFHLFEYFNKKGYEILNPDDSFYEINCDSYEYNGTDINLQTKIKSIYIKNVTQYNCSYKQIHYDQKILEENCSFYENDTKALYEIKETKISKIEKNYYYKNDIIHIKIFTCFNRFATSTLISNFLFYLGIIIFIILIIIIIIFHQKEIYPLYSILTEYFNIKTKTIQEEKIEQVEVEEKKVKKNKKNYDGLKYSYVVAIITNDPPKIEPPPKIEEQINVEEQVPKKRKKRTLKNIIASHKKGIIEDPNITNLDNDKATSLIDLDPDQEYLEYSFSVIPKPKKYVQKKSIVEKEIKAYELKPKINYQITSLGNYLLTHLPITNIIFTSKNNTGEILRFVFESHYLNVVFFITILFTLGIFNTLFFSDNLFVINYDKNGLAVSEYITYSLISAALNVVFGFILMLIYYSAQNLKPNSFYKEENFSEGIKNVISSYRCKVIGCEFFAIILGIISLYYCSLFGNIYPNTKKYLFIQIILSFIFENIFYVVIFIIVWLIIKMVNSKKNKIK